jgi:hypothetical protein
MLSLVIKIWDCKTSLSACVVPLNSASMADNVENKLEKMDISEKKKA